MGPIQVAPHQQPIETVKTFKVIPDNGNPTGSGNFEDSHSAGGFSSDDYLKLINILRQQYAPDEPIHMPRSKNVHVPHFKPVPAGKVFPKYPPANYGGHKGGYSGGYIDFDEYDDNDSSDDEGYDSGYPHGDSGTSHGDYPRGGYSHHGSSHAGSSHGDHSHQGTSHRGYYYHGPSHYRHSHGHVHHHRHPKSDFDHWHHDIFHGFDHVKKFKFFATLGGASGSSFH